MSETLTTDTAHTETARFSAWRELAPCPVLARFSIPGEPCSKARARHAQGRTYTPEKTKTQEQLVGWAFRGVARGHQPIKEMHYGVVCLFFQSTRRRQDVDNMLKLVCDGLNGVAWVDDAQVQEILGRRIYVKEKSEARTEVLVYELGATDPWRDRSIQCAQCGEWKIVSPTWLATTTFCSPECRQASHDDRRRRTCPYCGEDFVPPTGAKPSKYCSAEHFSLARTVERECLQCSVPFRQSRAVAEQRHALCSKECQVAWWRTQKAAHARGTCADCGGPTSKKQYARCRACNTAFRRKT